MTGTAGPARGCRRCGAHVHPDQAWCVACGRGLRTRIVPARGWRHLLLATAALATAALLALALAFTLLTRNDNRVPPAAQPTQTAPADGTVTP